MYDKPQMISCNELQFLSTAELPFTPTHLHLDQLEANFCIYGEGGIIVGNLPAPHEDNNQIPFELQTELVSPFTEEEEAQKNQVIQVEFSNLNTNYLYAMVAIEGCQKFKVIDLTSKGLQTEIEFDLIQNKQQQSSSYIGVKANKAESAGKFVSFSQNSTASTNDSFFSLDIF